MTEILTPVGAEDLAEDGTRYQITTVWRGTVSDITRSDGLTCFKFTADNGRSMNGVHGGDRGYESMAIERFDLPIPEKPGAVIRCLISSPVDGSDVRSVAVRRSDRGWEIPGSSQVYPPSRIVRVLAVLDEGGDL